MQGKGYDNRVSVIDLKSFTVESHVNVAPNLSLLRADSHGALWVASRGDYQNYPSRLYHLKKGKQGQMVVSDSIDTPVSGMAILGDSIYYYGSTYDQNWQPQTTYGIIDIKTTYGIMVHPITHDIYIMDATNYVSSGKLYCFDNDGNYKWVTWTGDIPGHAVFLEMRSER